MKLAMLLAAACVSLSAVASAQTYTAVETKGSIVGEVVRYEPGQIIVVKDANNQEVIYKLSPKVTIPADVQVGRRVTLYTEAGADGTSLVSRVVTTSLTPDGNVQKTTEETRRSPSGVTTKTTTTNITGKVEVFTPGKTLTIQRSDGSRVTYIINEQSQLPADLVVGKSVTIVPMPGSTERVAKIVTYEVVPQ
jgi:hypothetical protein